MKYLFPRGKTKLVFSALGFEGTYIKTVTVVSLGLAIFVTNSVKLM